MDDDAGGAADALASGVTASHGGAPHSTRGRTLGITFPGQRPFRSAAGPYGGTARSGDPDHDCVGQDRPTRR